MTRHNDKEYVVKDITGHSIYNGETRFRVIWEDFSYTYEPVKHLLKCATILRNYCLQADIPMPKANFDESIGAATDNQTNRQNFVQIRKVIKTINTYGTARRLGVKKVVPISKKPLKQNQYIIIIGHNNHGYVAAVDNLSKKITIADSSNNFATDDEIKKTVNNMFPEHEIIQAKYYGDTGTDHCGSAAALIAIHFRRSFATGKWTEEITPGHWLREKIVKIFHKHPTKKVVPPKNIKANMDQRRRNCDKCNKLFANYRKMRAHQLSCKSI